MSARSSASSWGSSIRQASARRSLACRSPRVASARARPSSSEGSRQFVQPSASTRAWAEPATIRASSPAPRGLKTWSTCQSPMASDEPSSPDPACAHRYREPAAQSSISTRCSGVCPSRSLRSQAALTAALAASTAHVFSLIAGDCSSVCDSSFPCGPEFTDLPGGAPGHLGGAGRVSRAGLNRPVRSASRGYELLPTDVRRGR